MQTTTLTPKFVNQPKKAGGKYGSIKDGNGTYWSVPLALLPYFRANEPVTVEWEQNGEYYNIKQIVGHAAPQPAPAPQPAYTPPAPPPQPAPIQHTNGHAAQPNGHDKDRAMFVMGITGRAMGSGSFSVNDVKILALAADDAWSELERRWNR